MTGVQTCALPISRRRKRKSNEKKGVVTRAAHHHDGINIYGDEVATNINGVAQIMEGMGLLPAGGSALVPSTVVTRTGYREVDLTDHVARSKNLIGVYIGGQMLMTLKFHI